MHDAIDAYLNEVLEHAALAAHDERRVRAELKDHLEELVAAAQANSSSNEEVLAMLHSEFGEPNVIGKTISSARGRFRTYVKKQRRRLPVTLAIALVLAVSIRFAVAEGFRAATNAVAPSIPAGSRMLVYKLASDFHSGDIIVFRSPNGNAIMGVVARASDDGDVLTVTRNGEQDQQIPRDSVVGRVVLNTR